MNVYDDELIALGSLSMRFLVDGRDTSGHMAMAEMIVQPQARVPPAHRHVDVDETIRVLEGELTYRVDDTVRVLKAGDHCFSPRGSVHHFSNPGDVPARALVSSPLPASARIISAKWQASSVRADHRTSSR